MLGSVVTEYLAYFVEPQTQDGKVFCGREAFFAQHGPKATKCRSTRVTQSQPDGRTKEAATDASRYINQLARLVRGLDEV